MPSVSFRHVSGFGGGAGIELPDMAGDAFTVKIDLNQLIAGMQFNRFADTMMRHRVKMLIVHNVVIDIDAGGFDVGVLIGVLGNGDSAG
jgi:hypothetical protein